jgi:hypothetical protein
MQNLLISQTIVDLQLIKNVFIFIYIIYTEKEQEAGTPQQFTPITVGPSVEISDK